MGQDAVFVHLLKKYHSKGLTKWLNENLDGSDQSPESLYADVEPDRRQSG